MCAFISPGPVVQCIHLLYGSLLVTELAIACLTLIIIILAGLVVVLNWGVGVGVEL
jgi:hypothetical protein